MAAKKSSSPGKKVALKVSSSRPNGKMDSRKAMLQEESMEMSKPKQQKQSKFPESKQHSMPKHNSKATSKAKPHAKTSKKGY